MLHIGYVCVCLNTQTEAVCPRESHTEHGTHTMNTHPEGRPTRPLMSFLLPRLLYLVGLRAGEGQSRGARHRGRDVRADPWGGEEHHPGGGEHERDHRRRVHERGHQDPHRSGADHEHLHDVSEPEMR